MELFIIGLPLAFLLPFISKLVFPHNVTTKEYLCVSGINVVIILLVNMLIHMAVTYDEEIWSGQVTSKYSEKVSCSHSYQCNPRQVKTGTDSKGNPIYTTEYDTCYEHNYDMNWVVESNIGEETINRIDRRGIKEPPRFSKVEVGEPFARSKIFTNYIKASPNTLFKNPESLIAPFKGQLPDYPSVYDYYRIDRVYGVGVKVDNTLNIMLNEMMRKWGPLKQANIIAVFVSEAYTQEYYQALNAYWLGGKKNDVVIVAQLKPDNSIGWTRVFSRAEKAVFDKSVEMDVSNMGQFTPTAFVKIIDNNINERFKRIDFEQYQYLLEDVRPSTVALVVALIVALIINLILNYVIIKYDF